MTMHMLPVYFSTTSTKKRKQKKSKKQQQTDVAHAKFLKKMGYKGGSDYRTSIPNYRANASKIETSDKIPVHDSSSVKKDDKVYSGKRKLLGIATMHKSNMVPVFSAEDAEELAKMRRG